MRLKELREVVLNFSAHMRHSFPAGKGLYAVPDQFLAFENRNTEVLHAGRDCQNAFGYSCLWRHRGLLYRFCTLVRDGILLWANAISSTLCLWSES